jgi:hypothetical protein
MQKTAQERSIWNKLREKTNLSGKVLESLNNEYQEAMDKVRTTDDKIREHADQIKNLIRSARSHYNRRDYLASAVNMSAFHEKCRYIAFELDKLIKSLNTKHFKMLLELSDEGQKEQLFGYNPNKEIQEEQEQLFVDDKIISEALQKKAGASDWWFKMTDPIGDMAANLASGRGRAMKALEKGFYSKFFDTLKKDTNSMVDLSIRFLQTLLLAFKSLATARATRNLKDYAMNAKKLRDSFSPYHNVFIKYYNTNILPLKQYSEEAAKEQQAKQTQLQEQVVQPNVEQPKTSPSADNVPEPPSRSMRSPEEVLDELKEKHGPESDDNVPIPLTQRKAYEFIASLEKFALNNDTVSCLKTILSYSAELENIQPETSLKLLAIAEGLSENYKTAQKRKDTKKEKDPLGTAPSVISQPVEHGIAEGEVNKRYTDIPFLKNITADRIRVSPGAYTHVANIFANGLSQNLVDEYNNRLDPNKIINEIRMSIPRGIILQNSPADDNPRDRQLEIYTFVKLKNIDKSLDGIVKLRVWCRLSVLQGILSLRTISKNFTIED